MVKFARYTVVVQLAHVVLSWAFLIPVRPGRPSRLDKLSDTVVGTESACACSFVGATSSNECSRGTYVGKPTDYRHLSSGLLLGPEET